MVSVPSRRESGGRRSFPAGPERRAPGRGAASAASIAALRGRVRRGAKRALQRCAVARCRSRATLRSSAMRASSRLHTRPAGTMAMQSTGQGGMHSCTRAQRGKHRVHMFRGADDRIVRAASTHNVRPMQSPRRSGDGERMQGRCTHAADFTELWRRDGGGLRPGMRPRAARPNGVSASDRRGHAESARHAGSPYASPHASACGGAIAPDAAGTVGGVDPDLGFRRPRSTRRRLRRLARADFGCGPHGHRRGVVRRRAHCRRRDRAPAVGASVLRLCSRGSAGRVRQCAGHARVDRLDCRRSRPAIACTRSGRRADRDDRGGRGTHRQSRRGLHAVARGERHQRPRCAAARRGRPAGLGGGARRGRGGLLDGLDADGSDSLARGRAPDPALDAGPARESTGVLLEACRSTSPTTTWAARWRRCPG